MPQLLCSDLSSAEIRQIPWVQFILVIWNVFHNFNFYQQILSLLLLRAVIKTIVGGIDDNICPSFQDSPEDQMG